MSAPYSGDSLANYPGPNGVPAHREVRISMAKQRKRKTAKQAPNPASPPGQKTWEKPPKAHLSGRWQGNAGKPNIKGLRQGKGRGS